MSKLSACLSEHCEIRNQHLDIKTLFEKTKCLIARASLGNDVTDLSQHVRRANAYKLFIIDQKNRLVGSCPQNLGNEIEGCIHGWLV